MANTTIECAAPPGLTLTVELYADGSDSIANGAGDTLTEATNRHGLYTATVTEALAGYYFAVIVDGSDNLIATGWVKLADDTSTYKVGERVVAIEGTLQQLDDLNNISTAKVNAEVVDGLQTDTPVAGVSVVESLRRIGAVVTYKISGAGTGTETFVPWDDGAETIVITVDGSGNRSAVTYN